MPNAIRAAWVSTTHRYRVAGVDRDPSMLAEARRRAPSLDWRLADLADLEIPGTAPFDAAVAAGNVFPYLTPGGTGVLVNRGAAATRRAPHRRVHARPREVAVWRSARRQGHARPLRPVVYSRGTVAAAPLGELGTCALRRR